jgi:hypothetical protein
MVEQSYLDTADLILEGDGKDISNLPRLFIWGLVEAEREKQLLRSVDMARV